jgi:hypothetical protein
MMEALKMIQEKRDQEGPRMDRVFVRSMNPSSMITWTDLNHVEKEE